MITQEVDILLSTGDEWPEITVMVPLYNYENYICETLDCVAAQTVERLGLVVVDDHSTDGSAQAVIDWLSRNRDRFPRALLARNRVNSRLSITRNTGTALTQSPLVFFLDADNHIYPRCVEAHAEALKDSPAKFAYSILEVFGADTGVMGTEVFLKEHFKKGNYIDAMAMIRRDALVSVGGYLNLKHGWEDYELWLRFCENGEFGIQVPEILGRYRVHAQSMLRTVTSAEKNYAELRKSMLELHPWLEI